ncbi:MAG: hypothetical protein KDA28_01230, partial [Phycisphaerales bacterium]|nr:hypothetical protein [Phycisphaerales bacterium]
MPSKKNTRGSKSGRRGAGRPSKTPADRSGLSWIERFRSPFPGGVRTAWAIVVLAGGLLGIGAIATGMGRLSARAAQLPGVMPEAIEIVWPPSPAGEPGATWLHEQFQDELLGVAYGAIQAEPSPFRPSHEGGQLGAIGRALDATGWFASTPIVRREAEGIIRVTGEWRLPAAVVRHDARDWLISWDGALLPVAYAVGESDLRVIVGVDQGPTRDDAGDVIYGTPWPGGAVDAGLELLSLSLSQSWKDQVAGVSVAEFPERQHL